MPWPRSFGLQLQRFIGRYVPELHKVAPLVLQLHARAMAARKQQNTRMQNSLDETDRTSTENCFTNNSIKHWPEIWKEKVRCRMQHSQRKVCRTLLHNYTCATVQLPNPIETLTLLQQPFNRVCCRKPTACCTWCVSFAATVLSRAAVSYASRCCCCCCFNFMLLAGNAPAVAA
jgi:hypothetical protein